MPETDRWLADYGRTHSDISIPALYWPSVLILVVGIVGLMWSLPVPDEFAAISPVLNWGSTFLMAAVVYYFIISISLAIGMLPFVILVTAAQFWLDSSVYSIRWISAWLVAGALFGLFAGQFPRGSTRQVLRDVQMLIIGPAWMLSNLYRRLGIPL